MTGVLAAGPRFLLATLLALGPTTDALAGDGPLRLQGLFCNAEKELDGALASLGRVRSFPAAAELANVDEVVCTYVDALHYLVATPVKIAEGGNGLLLPRYRGWLVGVVAGERVRPVDPAVEVYFVTPDTPTGAVVERRT